MSLLALKKDILSGALVWPLIEGGKGVAISNGLTSGLWAKSGGIGTFSGVNSDFYDENGNIIRMVFNGRTRKERHEELVTQSIRGGIAQARIAHDVSSGEGRIHMNILWEMGGAERILHGILDGTRGLIHGITCGAGMPYKLSEIAHQYNVYYYPIVSSARAFNILYKRGKYYEHLKYLGGVVYEDPWVAGGHNGISNKEDPNIRENPYNRVVELRQIMNTLDLQHVPIIMAGGVWWLNEWKNWLDNPEIGKIGFQFGTRPLVTQESPISMAWKEKLLKGDFDVSLNRFSPTGFYSSAVKNKFLMKLEERKATEISFSTTASNEFSHEFHLNSRTSVYIPSHDSSRIPPNRIAVKTPDDTLIFLSREDFLSLRQDQTDCVGCLSRCKFSAWSQDDSYNIMPDFRSFCIQKTLQDIAHNGSIDNNLMFAGHYATRFANDPFYIHNGEFFIPTVSELFNRILSGK